jgi:glycosyltransferase involved in cell wall biosynthesis
MAASVGCKVKIAFRLSALGYGGTERVFLSIADYLSERGHQVDFVIDKASGQSTEAVAQEKGHNVVSLNAARTWRTIVPFAAYIDSAKPDAYVTAYTETNAAALISSAIAKHKPAKIVTEHASLDEHWANKSFLRRMLLELIVRVGYLAGDRIVCVSEGMAKQLKARLKHRYIEHIHNPVRFGAPSRSKLSSRALLGIDPDAAVVIAVGRVSKQKNYLMLLKAISQLKLQRNLAVYIIGGVYEPAQRSLLDSYIVAEKLAEKVHFVDFTHDLQAYYESADVLVMSSAWEGFGNVLVEGLAFGLQIVSTNCNYGPSEILSDGQFGDLVSVGDHVAMAEAIVRALHSPKCATVDLRKRASDFSEDRIGNAYEKLIADAVRNRK